jgi:hypothetical protein
VTQRYELFWRKIVFLTKNKILRSFGLLQQAMEFSRFYIFKILVFKKLYSESGVLKNINRLKKI